MVCEQQSPISACTYKALLMSTHNICFQGEIRTRPVARQDSSPDIAHFVFGQFYVCDLDFDMTWGCGGWGGVGGLHCANFSSNQR